jgi:hypothetical protein
MEKYDFYVSREADIFFVGPGTPGVLDKISAWA